LAETNPKKPFITRKKHENFVKITRKTRLFSLKSPGLRHKFTEIDRFLPFLRKKSPTFSPFCPPISRRESSLMRIKPRFPRLVTFLQYQIFPAIILS